MKSEEIQGEIIYVRSEFSVPNLVGKTYLASTNTRVSHADTEVE